jgi:hypothetical protein
MGVIAGSKSGLTFDGGPLVSPAAVDYCICSVERVQNGDFSTGPETVWL